MGIAGSKGLPGQRLEIDFVSKKRLHFSFPVILPVTRMQRLDPTMNSQDQRDGFFCASIVLASFLRLDPSHPSSVIVAGNSNRRGDGRTVSAASLTVLRLLVTSARKISRRVIVVVYEFGRGGYNFRIGIVDDANGQLDVDADRIQRPNTSYCNQGKGNILQRVLSHWYHIVLAYSANSSAINYRVGEA